MRARVRAFIAGCLRRDPEPAALQAVALALYRWQIERNPPYRAFCAGCDPSCVAEIPAVPVGIFRQIPLCCFPPEQARLRFHTSGTSGAQPGVHLLQDAATYDLASAGWFRRCLPSAPGRVLALVPSPAQEPRSSLSHMAGLLFPDALWACEASGRVDADRAWAWLSAAEQPVFIAATALALAALLERPGQLSLPAGSVVMSTGGFKGRRQSEEPQALLAALPRRLGADLSVVGEYGMTELSSQLWARPAPGARPAPDPEGPYFPPPWLMPIAVDPGSGVPLPPGEAGQLRFVDLANDHSVLAIETLDRGTILPGGGLLLHGRLPGARARGCSLTVEEAAGH